LRFKTPTPPRLNPTTIHYSKTQIQPRDDIRRAFTFQTTQFILHQLPSSLTYTNPHTHQLIHHNLHLSPIYSTIIKPTPPTYSPSIHDKFLRFNHKPTHQLFLQPQPPNT
ncbi:FAD-dependent oxidoreductase, partial [Staphylococcus epidermidis]|uniref:FAD-dependent oxidoreductase n=1 Tax=Staphylococcus epidermidis TaxID=1282 RepID=UPI001643286B